MGWVGGGYLLSICLPDHWHQPDAALSFLVSWSFKAEAVESNLKTQSF